MEHLPVAAMPATLTAEALPRWLTADALPRVEIQSLHMGSYIVRLHHRDGTSRLVDERGETRRFTGTQWISLLLAPLGLTHGILTWADVTGEMVGLPPESPRVSPQQRLVDGTRVAFMTR